MQIDAATQAALERDGIIPHWLLWISARNRTTGSTETAGFWTGADDRTFTVDGQVRSYFGAGGLAQIGPITYEAGRQVRMQQVSLAITAPEVEQAIRTYDPRLAPAELHLALFDPDTMALVSITRAFSGWVDEAPIRDAAMADGIIGSVCEVTLASSSRQGTRTLTTKKSDSAQQRRSGDRGRRWADVSGSVPVWWGEVRVEA